MRKFLAASPLSIVFILLAALCFSWAYLLFESMVIVQDSSPVVAMRFFFYMLSGMGLVIIATRDFKRQRKRQREEENENSKI